MCPKSPIRNTESTAMLQLTPKNLIDLQEEGHMTNGGEQISGSASLTSHGKDQCNAHKKAT